MEKDLKTIINYYGVKNQTTIWIEELSELIKEICKLRRNFDEWESFIPFEAYKKITEEMGDVENILDQMKIVLNNNQSVQNARRSKIRRQLRRIADGE